MTQSAGPSPGTVLVVEDDADVREVLRHVLRQHNLIEAEDVAAAVAALREHRVDLVLLDLNLPGPPGMELLRGLSGRSVHTRPSVVVLSALSDEDTKVDALRLGADDYVGKPFGARELRTRVGAVLERRRQLRGLLDRVDDLEDAAYTDPLTGCGNRRAFDRHLKSLWRRSDAAPGEVALVLADVDGLKAVNDRGGHPLGDRVLRAVGHALQAATRHNERAYRIGGDEFAVIALADADAAGVLARRIESTLSEATVDDGVGGHVTASVGVAVLGVGHGGGPPDLFALADRVLYEAKRRRHRP